MEEAFAEAAKRRTGRRRRIRQLAVSTLLAAVAIVAVTMAVLWRRSEVARQHATAESLRAEAGKLQVIAERELLRYPTGALAYIMKSLELADTEAARLLALRVVQQNPVARIARASDVEEGGAGELGHRCRVPSHGRMGRVGRTPVRAAVGSPWTTATAARWLQSPRCGRHRCLLHPRWRVPRRQSPRRRPRVVCSGWPRGVPRSRRGRTVVHAHGGRPLLHPHHAGVSSGTP